MPKQVDNVLLSTEYDGKVYEITESSMTLGEYVELEEYTGSTVAELDLASVKAVLFLLYLAKRRADPDTQFTDVASVTIGDLSAPKKAPKGKSSTPANSGDQS